MYRLYLDLRDKLGEPQWHDDNGVPRYCAYAPEHGGIYDRWSALLEIACQSCGRRFRVSDGYNEMDFISAGWKPGDPREPVLPAADNEGGSFHFGDAPWHTVPWGDGQQGQCAGTTMSTETVAIVEFWIRTPKMMDWQRCPELEFVYGEGPGPVP